MQTGRDGTNRTPNARMITPEQWTKFFEQFAQEAIVKTACAAAGIGRRTVYDHLDAAKKADATPEQKEWKARFDEAERDACDVILKTMSDRAIKGVQEPLIGRVGKDQDGVVCYVTKFSDALLVRLAQARMPEMFKDRVAQEVTGKDGGPIKTETKVIAVPAIEEGAEE